MKNIKENLLETTVLDKNLKESRGNEHDVLISFLDAYKRQFPVHAREPTASHTTQVKFRPETCTDTFVGNEAIFDDDGNDTELGEDEDSVKKTRERERDVQ